MKLLFLTEFFPKDDQLIFTGGVEVRTFYVARQAKKDFSVKVISRQAKLVPATFLSLFSRLGYMVWALIKAMVTDFDLIEGSNFVSYLPAWLAAKFKKRLAVAWIADVLGKDWLEFGWLVGSFGWLMEKISLKLPWDGVIALSDSTKAKLLKAKIKTKQLSVVHAGIDPKEYQLSRPPEKFTKTTICCIARLVRTKRIDILIKALALLENQPNLRLLIIGRGPQKKFLSQLVQQCRLNHRVKLIDYLSRQELITTLYRSRIFCLPSVVEGFGIVTIEAMACGLPVVLASLPINQEITNFGQGTLFFKSNNETDLAKQLERLLTDKKLYRQKQLEALKLSRTYSWQKVYQQTKKFYETCLSH